MKKFFYSAKNNYSARQNERVNSNINSIFDKNNINTLKKDLVLRNNRVHPVYPAVPRYKYENFLLATCSTVFDLLKSDDEEYNKKYLTLSDEDSKIIKLMEKLNDSDLSVVENLIEDLIDVWWEKTLYVCNDEVKEICSEDPYETSSIDRLYLTYQRKRGYNYLFPSNTFESLKNVTLSQLLQNYTLVPQTYDILPEMAKYFDVSLHWLMCLDERMPCFSYNGKVDLLFDYYKLIESERKREIVRNMIELLADNKAA